MLKPISNRRGLYFATYYIYDTEAHKYVGQVEDRDNRVVERYFVAWKFRNNTFIPNSNQSGKTKEFYTFEDAINYTKEDFAE